MNNSFLNSNSGSSRQIILISSFCDTDEKLYVLRKNLIKLKEHNFDIAIISPLTIPNDIIEMSDFTFITKENPILEWPTHAMRTWRVFNYEDKNLEISKTYSDYGWCGLMHVKRMGEMFINYDYETFVFMIYDSILDERHFKIIEEGREGLVFPSKRGDDIWQVGLHLMIFDKKMLKRVIELIRLEDYLSHRNFDAFAFLHNNIVKHLQLDIDEIPVEDEIYFYDKIDILDEVNNDNFKIFISSPDPFEYIEDVKLFIYDVKNPFVIKITVNDSFNHYNIDGDKLISTLLPNKDIFYLGLEFLECQLDMTHKLKSIKNSSIKIS